MTSLLAEPGVFTLSERPDLVQHYRSHGYVVLRDVLDAELIDRMVTECSAAQQGVAGGRLGDRHGSVAFLDDESKAGFVNYVEYVQELSPAVLAAAADPRLVGLAAELLDAPCWLNDSSRFGVVYQDARPGRESGYTRIGWHADWQAAPALAIWPATAFTFHLDATSPANGFLRVVPGSHLWSTPAPYRNANGVEVPAGAAPANGYTDAPAPFPMPLGFEKIRGEVPVYAERGDVILHDAYLWHSAARATDDLTTRRHVRGGYFTGDKSANDGIEQFVKNAAR